MMMHGLIGDRFLKRFADILKTEKKAKQSEPEEEKPENKAGKEPQILGSQETKNQGPSPVPSSEVDKKCQKP
jgi:hypothetical protein